MYTETAEKLSVSGSRLDEKSAPVDVGLMKTLLCI